MKKTKTQENQEKKQYEKPQEEVEVLESFVFNATCGAI